MQHYSSAYLNLYIFIQQIERNISAP
jgi:hypothetical protein